MRGWFDLVSAIRAEPNPPTCRAFAKKRLMGFEPTTFCMASRRSSQLSYSRIEGGILAAGAIAGLRASLTVDNRRATMLFRQIIHEDLGCASYLVADRECGGGRGGRSAVGRRALPAAGAAARGADRARAGDPQPRRPRLRARAAGAERPGATIHIHELAEAEYEHEAFADGWTLELGDLTIEAMHTPGHRPEHTSFLLRDAGRGGAPWALLSGDSLFIGDVARPDLAVEPREGAADMFRSLHERLLALDDEVEVWPGHLGGSLCGGSALDLKTSSTIGFERRHNRRWRIDDEAEFVEDAVASLGDRPPNVEQIVALNRGPLVEGFGTPAPLTPHEVEEAVDRRGRRHRRPHQRAVRRGPHRRRPQHLRLRHRLRDQGLPGRARGGRDHRRRRLRRR